MASRGNVNAAWPVLGHELRRLLTGRAFWAMAVLMAPLTGYGFIEAARLFGEASRTALEFPELARGMSPLDGMLVPTLGAFYLGTTLLYPFIAIRAIGSDKESGSLKLAVQWPVSPAALVLVKLAAVALAWFLMLIAPLSALVLWSAAGGHLAAPETVNLLLGHALYAFVVAGLAFFAAAVTESTATAAIVTLAVTLGFWVLDFAAGNGPEWLRALGEVSPTQALRQFERGLVSAPHVVGLAALGSALVALAIVALPPGRRARDKLARGLAVIAVLAIALAAAPHVAFFADVSEDRRNSFSAADEAALARMHRELVVTLHLSPEDSRAQELVANVLGKLRRAVPDLTVRWAPVKRAGLFGAALGDDYGLVTYDYAGRRAESRSNSAREILPLLHELAGVRVSPPETAPYPGYPLVAGTRAAAAWFYAVLPAAVLVAAWLMHRSRRLPAHLKGIRP